MNVPSGPKRPRGTRRARAWWGGPARIALLLAGVAPLLPGMLRGLPLLHHVADALDGWFAFQCHREAARSLAPFGHVLAVCSRCAGIYLGLGLGALVLRPRLGAWPLRIWVGAAALVMVLDVATEALGMRPEWAALRLLTGVALAYPVAVAVVLAAEVDAPVPSEAGEQ